MPSEQEIIVDFREGLNTVLSPLSAGNSLAAMDNVWLSPTDVGAVEVIPGFTKVALSGTGVTSNEITGATFHSAQVAEATDGTRWNFISYINSSNEEHIVRVQPDGTLTEVLTHSTSPAITVPDFTMSVISNPYANNTQYAFFFNGTDASAKVKLSDGSLTATGLTQPDVSSGVSVALSPGGDSSVKGVVSYYVSLMSSTTEGPLSDAIGPIDCGGGNRVLVTLNTGAAGLPNGTYRVYRTQADGGKRYFVSQAVVSGASSFIDDVPDRDLGNLPFMAGEQPPTGIISSVVADNRIWGLTTDGMVYWSDLESPESWWDDADGNRLPINRDDGDKSIALARDAAGILVFKENHIYRVSLADALPTDVTEITLGTQETRSLGLAGREAITPIRQGLAWYWNRGVYLMVGGEVTYISAPIEDDLAAIRTVDEPDGVYLGFYPKRRHLYVSVPLSNGVVPTHTYIFDLDTGQWIGRMTTGFRGFLSVEGTDADEEFWGLDSDGGFIYKLDNGNNWAGTAISASLELPPIDGGGRYFRYHGMGVDFAPQASGAFNVVHEYDARSGSLETTSVSQVSSGVDREYKVVNRGYPVRQVKTKLTSSADQPRWKVYRLVHQITQLGGHIR